MLFSINEGKDCSLIVASREDKEKNLQRYLGPDYVQNHLHAIISACLA